MLGTFILVHARGSTDSIPPHRSLDSFPSTIAGWQSHDLPLSAEILETLGPGEFLFRDYVNISEPTQINLFIAFFPSQRAGDTIHSPKNCLPGAGWEPVESTHIRIRNKTTHTVNRYLLEKGPNRALVLYWYQAHGRVTPSEYWAKFHLVADALQMNRSDGAMVRIILPLADGESAKAGENRATRFAETVLPMLDDYIPR